MKWQQGLLATILSAPVALAAIGVSPVDTVLRMIANFFTFDALRNPQVQEGVIRFGLFITYFAIANYSLKNFFDKRTAGIASFVFAFLGIFLMPERWVKLTGGTISVIVGGGLILGLLGGLIYFAMWRMSGDWVQHLLGFLILIALHWLILIYVVYAGIPATFIVSYVDVGTTGTSPSSGSTAAGSTSSTNADVPDVDPRSWSEIKNDDMPEATRVDSWGEIASDPLSENIEQGVQQNMEYTPPGGN